MHCMPAGSHFPHTMRSVEIAPITHTYTFAHIQVDISLMRCVVDEILPLATSQQVCMPLWSCVRLLLSLSLGLCTTSISKPCTHAFMHTRLATSAQQELVLRTCFFLYVNLRHTFLRFVNCPMYSSQGWPLLSERSFTCHAFTLFTVHQRSFSRNQRWCSQVVLSLLDLLDGGVEGLQHMPTVPPHTDVYMSYRFYCECIHSFAK